MKKISHRLREQAALILAIKASTSDAALPGCGCSMCVGTSLGVPEAAALLSADAWLEAFYTGVPEPETSAEAECLLRCGWSPE